jgi:bifunctional DNA-binding transcriptional regulator/antitoxin component of YhaV-PrlF toxin-antitoxin module
MQRCDRTVRPLRCDVGTVHDMTGAVTAKVSDDGQTCLPVALRRRWGIDEGGEVGIIDLGDAALIIPGGMQAARSELHRSLRGRYAAGLAAIDDPDLSDQ